MVEKVSGYRVLSDIELALVNAMKAESATIASNLANIETVIKDGPPEMQGERMRSLALGKTNLQQAYMWLIRAVAAPQGLV
jgi:capsule polysaccharide export protein KpsE/RkpR